MKTKIDQKCPYCNGPTSISEIQCHPCGVSIKGPFHVNEFSILSGEELEFLRIFLKCEGRIKDMEAPLGLSYPTIRARLTQLKESVLGTPKTTSIQEALEELENGNLDFESALKTIKQMKEKK